MIGLNIKPAKINLMMLTENDRVYTLEVLRFFAALTVFFGHYVHFYMYFSIPHEKGIFFRINNPYGDLAVPIFFMISGAIFIHTYFYKIYCGEMGFIRFMQKRFARLYPLHFLTLIMVALLQATLLSTTHSYFIYKYNDIKNFFLNLLFISHWGFQDGYGFNGPVWSVSHEIFLYICFFAVCLFSGLVRARGKLFFFACIVIAILERVTDNFLARSAFDFFVGATLYVVLEALLNTSFGRLWRLLLVGLFISSLFALNHFLIKHGLPYGALGPALLVSCLTFDFIIRFDPDSWFCKISSFIGNISYSTYLLHFPVQLCFLLFSIFIIKLDFSNTMVLFAYVMSVMFVSVISYEFFEKPMKLHLSGYKSAIAHQGNKKPILSAEEGQVGF